MSCNWVPATQETLGGLLSCATNFSCHSNARSLPTEVFLVAALVTKPRHSTPCTPPSSRATQAASACRILSFLVGWGLRSQGDGEGGACVTPPPRAGRLAAARRKLEAGAELATDCATEPRRVPCCCCAARLPRLAGPVAARAQASPAVSVRGADFSGALPPQLPRWPCATEIPRSVCAWGPFRPPAA